MNPAVMIFFFKSEKNQTFCFNDSFPPIYVCLFRGFNTYTQVASFHTLSQLHGCVYCLTVLLVPMFFSWFQTDKRFFSVDKLKERDSTPSIIHVFSSVDFRFQSVWRQLWNYENNLNLYILSQNIKIFLQYFYIFNTVLIRYKCSFF